MCKERKKPFRLLRAILLFITIVCLIPIGQAYLSSIQHERQLKELRSSLRTEHTASPENAALTGAENRKSGSGKSTAGIPASGKSKILDKFKALYAANTDLAGWLTIEGTDIDYPVMQCEDDAYYLSHSFYGKKDKYGCLYVRAMADLHTPGTNFIIYGHNMKDGSMFGTLDSYEQEAYYLEHPKISFDTLYETRTYEIISVFRSQVSENDTDFKYYHFYQANTEEEFLDFYENVKKLALYDTGVTAKFKDTFLTLSTCSSHVENGRFVVVAKRIN